MKAAKIGPSLVNGTSRPGVARIAPWLCVIDVRYPPIGGTTTRTANVCFSAGNADFVNLANIPIGQCGLQKMPKVIERVDTKTNIGEAPNDMIEAGARLATLPIGTQNTLDRLRRASPHFEESVWKGMGGILDKDVTTVVKRTDDDSPNTVTTTIKNKPEKNSVNPHEGFMSPTQRRMIDMLDQSVAEL